MTSAVTSIPRAFAQRTMSTLPAVETWHTCSRAPSRLGEQHVARDDRLLGDRGPPGEAELGADDALVHLSALGEPRLLGVLGDDAAERAHVLERAAHEQRVVNALCRRR